MNKHSRKYLIFRKNTNSSTFNLPSKDKKLSLFDNIQYSDHLLPEHLMKRSYSNIKRDINYIDNTNIVDKSYPKNNLIDTHNFSYPNVDKGVDHEGNVANQNTIQTDLIFRGNNLNKDNPSFSNFENNKNEEVKLEVSNNNRIIEYFNGLECYICEITKSESLMVILECGHSICLICCRLYYEDKIETNEKELYCPKFQCKTFIPDEVLQRIVSQNYWNKYLKIKQTQVKKINNYFPTEFNKENDYKHILRCGNDFQQFKDFRKLCKEKQCRRCQVDSLFGKYNKDFYKCLNCSTKFCKLCLKVFTESHFSRNSIEYCKVYYNQFQIESKYSKEHSFFKDYNKILILLFLLYWVFLISGLITVCNNTLIQVLDPFNKNSNILKKIIKILIYSIGIILITLINIFVLILIIPIYPALATVLTYF